MMRQKLAEPRLSHFELRHIIQIVSQLDLVKINTSALPYVGATTTRNIKMSKVGSEIASHSLHLTQRQYTHPENRQSNYAVISKMQMQSSSPKGTRRTKYKLRKPKVK